MEFLKNHALDFLSYARLLLRDGRYNLSLFSLEQALQLGLKYYISKLTGSFPKTHDVVDLLKRIIELTGNKKLKEILDAEIPTLNFADICESSRSPKRAHDLILDLNQELCGVPRVP